MRTMKPIVTAALASLLVACGTPDAEPHAHPDAAADEHADEHATAEAHGGSEQTRIAAAIAAEAGIRVASAGPGNIVDEHVVQGLLTPVEGASASVVARFPGPIRRLLARAGDAVRAGQVLAVVESNLSLSDYEVTAPISGTVLASHAALGDMAREAAPLYEIADLRSLWVDLHVFGSDAEHFRAGLPVEITRLSDGVTVASRIDRLLPGVATASQSTIARATLANGDGMWRPGAAVRARITVATQPAALVVPLAALQSFENRDVVFVRNGETYAARPVELGARDARQVQVLTGLAQGEEVVIEQSYLVKADLEKAGATHEH